MDPIRILAINGSPRGEKSNTDRLLKPFLVGAGEAGAVCETIYAGDLNVHDCTGCFTCWKTTPGVCVFRDDMDILLQKISNCDILVWATPLYHYGMNVRLRRIIERTLPLSKPYMIRKNGKFSHPRRFEGGPSQMVLISNCGFPERSNFDALVKTFEKISGNRLVATILCGAGELLGVKELAGQFDSYLGAVATAGRELVALGQISSETNARLLEPLIAVETFVSLANTSWEVAGDKAPSLAEALRDDPTDLPEPEKGNVQATLPESSMTQAQPQLQTCATAATVDQVMQGMVERFNPEEARGLQAVYQFKFQNGDMSQCYHFRIADGRCSLHPGPAVDANITVFAPAAIWLAIARGELDGTTAFMEGKYRFEGQMELFMKLRTLFSRKSASSVAESAKKRVPQGPIKLSGMQWLTVAFIPWIYFWIFSGKPQFSSFYVPFLISLGILIYRKCFSEVTLMDLGSPLFFGFTMGLFFIAPQTLTHYSGVMSNLALGLLWTVSLVLDAPVTAAYSKYQYPADMANNSLFIKINAIITAFWVSIYILQAGVAIAVPTAPALRVIWQIGLNLLLIPAFIFTKTFPNWYIGRKARGKEVSSGQILAEYNWALIFDGDFVRIRINRKSSLFKTNN